MADDVTEALDGAMHLQKRLPAPLCALSLATVLTTSCAHRASEGVSAPPIRLASPAAHQYRARVTEQVGIEALVEDAKALRFRLKSAIMRERWGDDQILRRQSWAVPLGIVQRGPEQHLAVATTRCVLDYTYPLEREMPKWSNLALFSESRDEGRRDVRREVFRLGSPAALPGVSSQYDPKRDAFIFTNREYLDGPVGERYFGPLKQGLIRSASADLPVGDWADTSGVDLAVVYIPLSDPGVAALVPSRNLGIRDPIPALRAVLAPRTSLWGDTFQFSTVSRECMAYAREDFRTATEAADRWRSIAFVAGAFIVAGLLVPGIAAVDASLLAQLGKTVGRHLARELWRSATEPLLGTAARGAYWSPVGRLILQMALSNGSIREYVLAGIHRLGLSEDAANAILQLLQNALNDPGVRVSTMERPTGPPVASVLIPHANVDFAGDLIRRGLARLDPNDVGVLVQQPTLVTLAQEALADPDTAATLLDDVRYRRAVRDLALALAQ